MEKAGVYQFGIRVVLRDGREAIWDTDGTLGLEAQVMRDGMLVGFVPQLAGSEDWDDRRCRGDQPHGLRPADRPATHHGSGPRGHSRGGRGLPAFPGRLPLPLGRCRPPGVRSRAGDESPRRPAASARSRSRPPASTGTAPRRRRRPARRNAGCNWVPRTRDLWCSSSRSSTASDPIMPGATTDHPDAVGAYSAARFIVRPLSASLEMP